MSGNHDVRNINMKTEHQIKHGTLVCVQRSIGCARRQVTDCVWCQNVNEERAHCLVAMYLVYRVVPRRGLIVRPSILDLHHSETHHHTQAQSLSGSQSKLSSSRPHAVSNVAEGEEEEGTV